MNDITHISAIQRLVAVVGNRSRISLSVHDVRSADAVQIVKSFPIATITTNQAGSRDYITIAQGDVRIMVFLAEPSTLPPVTHTPVADRILAEAGR